MPAERFTHKANTPVRRRQWDHVYQNAKARGLSEKSAIMEANGVVRKSFLKARRKRRQS